MKTLKKALCLILALTMVVGTLALSASAADFKDQDKIEYDEAVAVLTGIGAISGRDDGNYDPTAGLQRQEGVAIVVRALLKRATADKLTGTGDYYKDVDSKAWSAGYIEYATDKAILNGVGEGKFDPRGELTGYAFAKMLLAANGIKGEFTGSAWKNNVLIAADENDFTKNMKDFDYSKAITRDEAAAMAYNAIQYSAEGEKSSYVVTSASGTELYKGDDPITALLMTQGNAGATLSTTVTKPGSIVAQYGYAKDSETDAFGRTTAQITNGKSGKDKVVYYGVSSDLVKEYTEAVSYGKIVSDAGFTKVADNVSITLNDNSATGVAVGTKNKTNTAAADTIGGNGTLIQVYKNGEKALKVVKIDTYVALLDGKDNTITAAKKATATADATKGYVTIKGVGDYETEAFAKNDIVLYTKADGKIQSMTKADYISGEVTATATGYVRIDGNKYAKSANADKTVDSFWSLKNVATYYLDNNNNVIYAKAGQTAAVDTDYIYVIATAAKAAKSDSTDLFATVAGTAAVAQAKVVDLETGASAQVNQGIVVNSNGSYYAKTNGSADTTKPVVDQTAAAGAINAGIWSYAKLSDGSIALDKKQTPVTVTLGADNNKASIGISGKYANSATKLVVLEITNDKNGNFSSAKVANYTGMNNFPKLNNVNAIVEYSANNQNLATKIIVVKNPDAAVTKANYAVYLGAGETTVDGTKGSFSVKGATVDYYLDSTVTVAKDNVYDITVTDGKVTAATAVTYAGTGKTVADIQEGFIVVDGSVLYLASDVVIIDKGDDYKVATLAIDDVISYTVNSSNQVNFILIAE